MREDEVKEKELVQKIRTGDQAALREFIEQHEKLVGHIVFRMIPIDREREDICQDIFIKIYQNLSSFQFKSKLSTWIGRIAYNSCVNFLEKKKIPLWDDLPGDDGEISTPPAEIALPDEITASADISLRLQHELMRLPVLFSTILTLFYLEELSYREIGAIMNLPEGTVKSYLFRGRKHLKDRLLKHYRQEELWT